MPISSSTVFDVADQTPLSVAATVVIGAPVGVGTGRGRLIHPDLGAYDYENTPTETVGIDGDITASPLWSHAMTLASGVDTV